MKSKFACALAALLSLLTAAAVTGQQPVQGQTSPCPPSLQGVATDISLSEAVTRAIACNGELGAAGQRIKAADARSDQAALFPNPELELEYENFGGHDELSGFAGADSTISISQPIQLGGSRARRRDVADAEVELAMGNLDLRRRDVVYRTTTAFFELLAAQQAQVLAEELLDLALGLGRTVDARVEAGRVSPVESTRARIETARARVDLSAAQHRVQQARIHLAIVWNNPNPDFSHASGRLPIPEPAPPLPELINRLADVPEIVLMRRNLTLREHSLELEKALAIPDLRLSVGSRHFRDNGQSAWVAGLSVPIPVFDRNQGARSAAEFEIEAATRQIQSVTAEQEGRLRILMERLLATETATRSMAQVVEPAASEAFSSVELGYLEGKFAFADLLQSQQALFEARRLALESRLEYALARCDLERLVGPISLPDGSTLESPTVKEPS